jgi:pyruvate dehydrogenase E2 component (dihydrolipoamide acetyltransferase)
MTPQCSEGDAMPASVTMPRLGESVTEGTVTHWLKQVGDRVGADEPLLEVSSDKVDTELVSPATGVLIEILVAENTTVDVGTALATISTGSERARPAPHLTLLVRNLAKEHRLDLSTITGTGANGRIRKADVLAAVRPRAPMMQPTPTAPRRAAALSAVNAAPGDRVERMSRLRQVIATRMVESLQTSAQLTTVVEVDVTRLAQLRQRSKLGFEKRTGVKLTFLPFFALAAIEALQAYPLLNSSVDTAEKSVTYHAAQHLGIAVDTDRGLMAPVVRDAGDLNLTGLARNIAELAARARANTIGPDELAGGTFTLTNTGSRGALFDTPIVTQPQVAILGTGSVVDRPVVVHSELGKTIAIRSMVYLALSYDHRIVDGADAARFLTKMKTRLEGGNFDLPQTGSAVAN